MEYAKKEVLGKWGFVNNKGEPICKLSMMKCGIILRTLRQLG